ncbi:GMC oxidoreductase domain-containing protein [Phthorimaea operculella]|nr:GMC oxidoreductase domain-containing protein [Phthorimaea operculella]
MPWIKCKKVQITTYIVNSYSNALPVFTSALQTFLAAQCALVGDSVWPADALDKVQQGKYQSNIDNSYSNALPVFTSALQAFLAAQCALVGDSVWPADALDKVQQGTNHDEHSQLLLQCPASLHQCTASLLGSTVRPDPNYDFIVVGAGSAGAVVANRLSEVPDWKVLLIEAGGNPTLGTEIPQIFFSNFNSEVDWAYKPEPQAHACKSYVNGRCAFPRGKVLGGSSSTNGLYYVRGNKLDYDEWAAAGNPGWSYEDVLPYFKKSESYSGDQLSGDLKNYHSTEGYLSVDCPSAANEFEKMVIAGASQIGVKSLPDFHGADQMGVSKACTTSKDGVRHSTARAFLAPFKDRSNLHVLKNAHVTKLVFKDNTNEVTGVLVHKDGKEFAVSAKKEVILSAGAINSPQILMLSGIGPKKHLESLGIEVKADLQVGENLQDHPYLGIYYAIPADKSGMSTPTIVQAFTDYMLSRQGLFNSTAPFRVLSFLNTTDPAATSPDIQNHHLFFPANIANFVDYYGLHGFNDDFRKKFQELNEDHLVFIVCPVLLHPKSRGKVELKSTDPFEAPKIIANFFEEPEDIATMLRGIKQYALKLGDTDALKSQGFKLQWLDLDDCKNFDKNSDEFLQCWLEHNTVSLYHQTSTAKMGPDSDETAVVNHELKVRNVDRLRVIDASIMPVITRGNTNAPSIMIGEKGADLIKSSWL